MSFNRNGLYQVGPGGSSPRLWVYSSADAIAAVNTSGYFNNASSEFGVRDVIFAIDTATPSTHIVNVLSNASGVVDVSDGTVIVETDTD
tara:strand:+ start:14273 stop:14539 length:267 start_codon:yes stop_codon:yes gene_type:complete